MAQLAHFWTHRAGTPVYSHRGDFIGWVVAVRPDAVLVSRDAGHERWFDAAEIIERRDHRLIVVDGSAEGRSRNLVVAERTGIPAADWRRAQPQGRPDVYEA